MLMGRMCVSERKELDDSEVPALRRGAGSSRGRKEFSWGHARLETRHLRRDTELAVCQSSLEFRERSGSELGIASTIDGMKAVRLAEVTMRVSTDGTVQDIGEMRNLQNRLGRGGQ